MAANSGIVSVPGVLGGASPAPPQPEWMRFARMRETFEKERKPGQRPPWPIKHIYEPAVAGIHWRRVTAETATDQILSVLDLTFLADVDVSDPSTGPGKLWQAVIEYTCTIPGCISLRWVSEGQSATVYIFWNGVMSWKYFQESTGFMSLVPVFARDMGNRSVRILDVPQAILGQWKELCRIETTFSVDLDPASRFKFEEQCSSAVDSVFRGSQATLASGWVEHNVSASVYAIGEDNAAVRTQCTHIILLHFNGEGDRSKELSELVENLSGLPVLGDWEKTCVIKPVMLYHKSPKLLPRGIEPPVPEEPRTLADTLHHQPSRVVSNIQWESLDYATLRNVSCQPKTIARVAQGYSYNVEESLHGHPRFLYPFGVAGHSHPPAPHMVDVAWITTRSSLDRVKKRVAKMLNYRVRQLTGYHSGFWVRAQDSEHEFGVFTVWESETTRASCRAEYRELLDRFVDASSYVDVPPVRQAFPWPRSTMRGEPNRTSFRGLTEVITFWLPRDVGRRELFERAFAEFRSITAPMMQSGHAPDACLLAYAGGWAPTPPQKDRNREAEDIFTCCLEWELDEARAPWYKNLGLHLSIYDDIGRCADELKMLAEGGIESQMIMMKDEF